MTVPQPAATRRRAKTLAAGGFFAAERNEAIAESREEARADRVGCREDDNRDASSMTGSELQRRPVRQHSLFFDLKKIDPFKK
ncbi:MAG: hypothetical protein VYB44_06735 [Bacteroidota bacterium]|nr:hypothetical protein [Bacteroidota bacterium]